MPRHCQVLDCTASTHPPGICTFILYMTNAWMQDQAKFYALMFVSFKLLCIQVHCNLWVFYYIFNSFYSAWCGFYIVLYNVTFNRLTCVLTVINSYLEKALRFLDVNKVLFYFSKLLWTFKFKTVLFRLMGNWKCFSSGLGKASKNCYWYFRSRSWILNFDLSSLVFTLLCVPEKGNKLRVNIKKKP